MKHPALRQAYVIMTCALDNVTERRDLYAFATPRTFHLYVDGSGGNQDNPESATWSKALLSAEGFNVDESQIDKYL